MEVGRKTLLNTDGGIDGSEDFWDEIRAIVGKEEIGDSKNVYPMGKEGIYRDGCSLLGQGDCFRQFSVPISNDY